MGFRGCDADICVRAQRERLSAAKAKRNLRVYDEGMVLKESFKAVFLGEPVVIVLNAQEQIMPLRHEISEADFKIKAPEIEAIEAVVIKQLLTHIDQSVQRASNPWLVKRSSSRRQYKIALFST